MTMQLVLTVAALCAILLAFLTEQKWPRISRLLQFGFALLVLWLVLSVIGLAAGGGPMDLPSGGPSL